MYDRTNSCTYIVGIRKRDYARSLPTYMDLFSAAVARFITLAFFRAQCRSVAVGRPDVAASLVQWHLLRSALLRACNERTRRTRVAAPAARTLRIVLCVRTRFDTNIPRLDATNQESFTENFSAMAVRGLSIVRLFLLCLPTCIQRLSDHARIRARLRKEAY